MYAVAAIELGLAPVVLPDDAELDDPFGNGDDVQGGPVLGVLFEEGRVLEGTSEF